MKRLFILISSFVFFIESFSQISTEEMPLSFRSDITSHMAGVSVDLKTMPALDMDRINQEDLQEERNGVPPRFGFLHKVNFDLDNSGTWTTLDNGDKIWQLSIYCPNALSVNLLYEKFWMPEKAKFFIYSGNKKHILGAFTSVNNKGTKENIQGFATGLVYSDKITLEYYQPSEIKEQGTISLAYIVHGYRYIKLPEYESKSFGDPGNYCQVNINCPEGQNWQNEKNSIALILVNGNRYCTGSLINTTANDNRPLFLTADHCLGGWANDYIKYDAISNPNLNHWSFYWHYESPTCSNSNDPPIKSTVGATVLANNSISDFALLQLTEDPRNKTGVTPYYLGWDRSGNSGTGGVGIHHPAGDVKKISTYSISPFDSYCANSNLFWDVRFISTINGHSVMRPGSSGSPLINSNHHIIGQLCGPYDLVRCPEFQCEAPDSQQVAYGKFSVSWTGNGATDSRRCLNDWLDPCGSNVMTLNGIQTYSITGSEVACPGATYKIDNLPDNATVMWSGTAPWRYTLTDYGDSCTISDITIAGDIDLSATIITCDTIIISKEIYLSYEPDYYTFYATMTTGGNTDWLKDYECLLTYTFPGMYSGEINILDPQGYPRIENATWAKLSQRNCSFADVAPSPDGKYVFLNFKPYGCSAVVRMTATNDCGSFYTDYTFRAGGPCYGIESIIELPQIRSYPNPTEGEFTVEYESGNEESGIESINVTNSSGIIIINEKCHNQKIIKLDISKQLPGIYFIEISDGKNQICSQISKK